MNLFMLLLGYEHECGRSSLGKKEEKIQKMGGVQVCNEASMALLAHEQTRASVMSVQRDVVGRGEGKQGGMSRT